MNMSFVSSGMPFSRKKSLDSYWAHHRNTITLPDVHGSNLHSGAFHLV
jgi:hypothetical protein